MGKMFQSRRSQRRLRNNFRRCVSEQLEQRLAMDVTLSHLQSPIRFAGDVVFDEPVFVDGQVTVILEEGHSLRLGPNARLSGNADAISDTLFVDAGGTFRLDTGARISKGGNASGQGGLSALTVEAGSRIREHSGPAIVLSDDSRIDLPGATLELSTRRGFDLNLLAVTPLFKDQSANTGIFVGNMDIVAANVGLISNATTSKVADFVVDPISLNLPQFATQETTARFTGNVTLVKGLVDTDGQRKTDSIVRATGSWLADGFQEGRAIRLSNAGSNNGLFLIASVTDTRIELSANDALVGAGAVTGITIAQEEQTQTVTRPLTGIALLTFVPRTTNPLDNSTIPAKIIRSGGSWINDRFLPGHKVEVSGGGIVPGQSGINVGKYTVRNVLDLELELVPEENVRTELAAPAYSIVQTQHLPNVPVASVDMRRTLTPGTPLVVTGPDRILRLTGSWAADGFAVGDTIAIEESHGNDGVYKIVAINGQEIVLDSGDVDFPIELQVPQRRLAELSDTSPLTFEDGGSGQNDNDPPHRWRLDTGWLRSWGQH